MAIADIVDIYPLSPMQQGMLFHSLYAPDSGVYIELLSCTLHGALDVPAFERAWQQVIDRHAILRTAFVWEDFDEPLQVVHQQVQLPLEHHDWRIFPPAAQEAHLDAFMQAEQARGFDLAQAPLMRLTLMRLTDEAYQFVWTHHHLLLDGWCFTLLLREVLAFYDAYRQGQSLQLERSRPYRDYIAWLQQQDMAKAEAFWCKTLQGFTAPTPLPGQRPPGSNGLQPDGYHTAQLVLPEAATEALQVLARQHQLTLNTLVQGAWALLLQRYSGEEDVVFGATVSGRTPELAGAEKMMGVFINTLPVRVAVQPHTPLLSWLKALQVQQAELREYEYTPLVQVQGWSEVPHSLPLFESILIFENYPVATALRQHEGALKIRHVRAVAKTNYPLTVVAAPGRELSLRMLYDGHRFDHDTIMQLLRHLQSLLEGFVAAPEQPIATLPLLTGPERQQVLVAWNATRTAYPHDRCVHAWFDMVAEQHPQAIAVLCGDTQVTYRELNARANQLAHALQRLGIGPEALVGLCLERSVEMVVALLGVLKAGGAFLPLDPAYPAERLEYMVADSGVSVLLTQQSLVERLPAAQAHIMCLDQAWEAIAREPTTPPVSGTVPENLAYVIYTSGSTGQPKGTMLQHRGVCNLATAQQHTFGVQEGDRILQFSSLSFDAAVWEVVMALLSGATLGLASRDHLAFGQGLLEVLRAQRITTVTLPPSVLAVLPEEPLPDLRTIITAGEACAQELVDRWAGGRRYFNAYGPTETTVCASMFPCTERYPQGPPIGRPLANTQLYILDANLQPVPVGVVGELYIGGVGLARGYLERPALTAEKFLPHPFSTDPGARLYKSGDLVRYLPDGNIDYVGRLDQQVKVRGFRIELGEIEAVLGQHPAVRDVAVLAREDGPGERRVAAYVVLYTEAAPDLGELRSFLRQRVPEYMVPSVFVRLEAMPLTPSGKVDRRALPVPDQERLALDDVFVAPRTPIEELLAEMWAEVLGVERVGLYDSFFDLGGHSLLATRLVARLREALQVEISLRNLFEAPTVATLAARIETVRRAGPGLQAPPILPVARDGGLPLSFAQQRLWFLDQLVPGSAAYNIPAALRIRGKLEVAALERSLQEIVRRHEVMRTTFASVNGRPVQVISQAMPLPLACVDLTELSEHDRDTEARRLATAEAQRSFDLTQGPLLRTILVCLGAEDHVFLLTMHHILSDAWSMGVLIQEFATLYEALTNGRPSPLPELPVQYADFAFWQRQWLQGEALENQLAYWKQQLAGSPPVLALPTDRPRLAVQTFHGAEQVIVLSQDLSKALRDLSRREGVTLFMTLLAAFQTLLHRYSGQDDILVGSPIANRTRAETERMIGFFINTLVWRTNFSGAPTFRDVLRQVRDVALGSYTHQDLPFEQLVDALQPERDMSYAPLFQVAFSLQHAPEQTLQLPGLTFQSFKTETRTAKYDLTLFITEAGDVLIANMEYNTALFDATTITRLMQHFTRLLEGVTADPAQDITDVPLLTASERQQMLVVWNEPATDYPQADCLQALFEAQVERSPDAIAVVYEAQHFTYRELNRRANRLAHRLQALGVGPEVLVGLCVERSLEMVIGILGILKAGGAYVPLDTAYPQERLTFMLQDAQVAVLVMQASFAEVFAEQAAQVVFLDTDWGAMAQEDERNPSRHVMVDNPAYVIYTSGSTGQPKGVPVSHANVVRLFAATQAWYHFTTQDVWTLFHSYAFDFSVWELWGALLYGGRLVVVPYWVSRAPDAFYDLVEQEQVTVLNQTPSAFRQLVQVEEALRSTQDLALRLVIFGGEALELQSLKPWFARHGDQVPQLVNMYGITETTVHVTYRPLTLADLRQTASSLIGRPIPDLQVYVLDHHLQPVPIGVPGEMYVGGAGLGRGYLARPGLTAERFVPNPFSRRPGARLYKTGDLARYLPNGDLEYLGRIDHQVKVRGFRIELGEIETALTGHPALREAVVVAREDVPNEKRLVAYLVPDPQRALPIRQLMHFEREGLLSDQAQYELPNGMVILHKNKSETDFMYKEIFEEQVYLKHGITLEAGSCIFDVGANIGLFSLFAGHMCDDAVIYAFEPIPPIFDLLRLNAALYGFNVKPLAYGLASEAKSDTFTYYPHVSVISGRFADVTQEREVVKSFLLHQQQEGTSETLLDEMLAERLTSERLTCQFKTLSEVLHEYGIARVDLLKIDVEKSELDVLDGIQEDDWHKIRQVVVEVHDVKGRLERVTALLEGRGYSVSIQQEALLKDTGLYSIYAVRPLRPPRPASMPRGRRASESTPMWSSAPRLLSDLRRFVQQRLPEYMVPSAFVLLEALPLNPNGKVDRRALPAPDHVRPALESPFVAPRTPEEECLASIWTHILGLEQVGVHDNFFELGGDSMMSIQVIARAHQAGLWLTPTQVFQYPTIAGLARVAETAEAVRAEQGVVTGPVPLTPIQHWFFENQHYDPHHWNWAFLRAVPQALEPSLLEQTMQYLLTHHDALRMRFDRAETGWQQVNAPVEASVPLHVVDVSGVAPAHLRQTIESVAAACQTSLHLSQGPLLRVVYVPCGPEQPDRMLMIFHHLVVDVVSARILMEDFYTVYQQLRHGEAVCLPPKTTSFQAWARRLTAYAQAPALRQEVPHWTASSTRHLAPLPVDYPGGIPLEASVGSVIVLLSPEETQALLEHMPAACGAQIQEVLLTAVVQTLCHWTGQQTHLIDLEGHGREAIVGGVDLSRTVGWFTTMFPVLCELEEALTPMAALQSVQARLREMPQRGIGFGLLRYLCEESDVRQRMQALPRAEVNFNYLGQFDQQVVASTPFRRSQESTGPERSGRGIRPHLLYIVGVVEGGKLRLRWSFSQNVYKRETIERLARYGLEALRRLIAHGLSAQGQRP